MSIDFKADAVALTTSNDSLSGVADLARQAKEIGLQIEDLEVTLAEKKEAQKELLENRIPEALREIGMSKFEMTDGSMIEVKQYYSGSIPANRKGEAFEWLRSNGYDDIIKNTVACNFGRGEDEVAKQFAEFASTQGFDAQTKTEVHPQTLRAFIKERVETGEEFPMELFGAWVGQRATVKRKKGNN